MSDNQDPTADKGWWEKWHPDKAPGKGRPKATGGKAGIGNAPTINPDPNNRKKGGDS